MSSEAPADSLFSWLDVAGNLNVLDVDVVMSTSDKREARLTDHVVETGAVVTDHIVIQPEQLSFELVVTQSPMIAPGFAVGFTTVEIEGAQLNQVQHNMSVRSSQFKPGGFLFLSQGLTTAVTNLFGLAEETPSSFTGSTSTGKASSIQIKTIKTDQPVDRVNDAHDTLIEIMNTGLLVTVSFKGRIYTDYLLRSVELTQGPNESGMGRFKVEVRAFHTVSAVNVKLPDPADFRALPKSKKGNKPTTTPDPDPTKAKSILKRNGVSKVLGIEK
jgi:hypothetical protein